MVDVGLAKSEKVAAKVGKARTRPRSRPGTIAVQAAPQRQHQPCMPRDWLSNQDTTAAGRYAFWTNSRSDEAIMSGLQADERAERSKWAEPSATHENHEIA